MYINTPMAYYTNISIVGHDTPHKIIDKTRYHIERRKNDAIRND